MLKVSWIKSQLVVWQDSGQDLSHSGNVQSDLAIIYYPWGDLMGTSVTPLTTSYWIVDIAPGDKANVMWFAALHASGTPSCASKTLQQCESQGSIISVASVSTSTNGTAGATFSYDYTFSSTTSTSSPPSYHNYMTAGDVVLGGLLLVVVLLLSWKR